MKIGEVSSKLNISVKTIRYYCDINLIKPKIINLRGYRVFEDLDLTKLQLINKARSFGFTLKDCKNLIDLFENKNRKSQDVKKISIKKIEEIDDKIKELKVLKTKLKKITDTCEGNNSPHCTILESFIFDNK